MDTDGLPRNKDSCYNFTNIKTYVVFPQYLPVYNYICYGI